MGVGVPPTRCNKPFRLTSLTHDPEVERRVYATKKRWKVILDRYVQFTFYESDCLGRIAASRIAERSGPEQSAPVACGMRRGGVCGSAGQSASAWFSSLELPIPTGRRASTTVARAQTMVLSETRPGAGLTLLRVLRRGLELGEYLGPTADWANENCETALRTRVPVPEAVA